MSKGDTARQSFSAAPEEIIARMQQRDTVLLGYLAFVGAIFGGLSGATPPKPGLPWLIPFLDLGASILVAQHHEMIGSIQNFLVSELEPFLKEAHEEEQVFMANRSNDAWEKSSKELATFFADLMPDAAGLIHKQMFGWPCFFVNGNLFAGLHKQSMIFRLSDDDRALF